MRVFRAREVDDKFYALCFQSARRFLRRSLCEPETAAASNGVIAMKNVPAFVCFSILRTWGRLMLCLLLMTKGGY